MKILTLALIASLGSIATVQAASTDSTSTKSWTYSARIPATATSCEAAAQDLAIKLRQSSAEITRAEGRCITRSSFQEANETFHIDTIEVSYSAPSPIRLYQASLPTYEMVGTEKTYPTYRSCLDNLAAQSALFAQATELSPLTAKCEPGLSSWTGYSLNIEGVGQAKKLLKTFRSGSVTSVANHSEWRQTVIDLLIRSGGMIALQKEDFIAYYGDRGRSFSTWTWLYAKNRAHCESQVSEAEAMLNKLGATQKAVICHENAPSHFVMDTAADVNRNHFYESIYHGQVYFSFEECMAIRDDVKKRDPDAARWLGSFCVPRIQDNQYFELKVFTRM